MSGICIWNILEGLQKRGTNPKIIKTPYSTILATPPPTTAPPTIENWPQLAPLSPTTSSHLESNQASKSSAKTTIPSLNKKYELPKHQSNNQIQQYPKEISMEQISLLKIWITCKILRPFSKDIALVNSVYPLLNPINPLSTTNNTIPFSIAEAQGENDPLIVCEKAHDLQHHVQHGNPWALRRCTYELFLQIPGTDQSSSARKYLINRIQELSKHSQLINYQSDARMIKGFEASFATDGQLLLHFVDTFLKINAPYHSQSILQFVSVVNRIPDEYGFTHHRQLYKMEEQSLMSALVAFVLYVQEECAGYFGLLNLATPMVAVPNLL